MTLEQQSQTEWGVTLAVKGGWCDRGSGTSIGKTERHKQPSVVIRHSQDIFPVWESEILLIGCSVFVSVRNPKRRMWRKYKRFLHNDAWMFGSLSVTNYMNMCFKDTEIRGETLEDTKGLASFPQTHLGVITHQPREHGWPSFAYCFSLQIHSEDCL